jgi:hypothetical protein
MKLKNKRYIYSEVKKRLSNPKFDKIPMNELQEMVGWIEPPHTKNGRWDVTMADGSIFLCRDQATAQIISDLQEIKAMLLEKRK